MPQIENIVKSLKLKPYPTHICLNAEPHVRSAFEFIIQTVFHRSYQNLTFFILRSSFFHNAGTFVEQPLGNTYQRVVQIPRGVTNINITELSGSRTYLGKFFEGNTSIFAIT